MRIIGGLGVAMVLAALSGSSASAAVSVGQLAPGALFGCNPNREQLQPTVTSGTSYVMPASGTITTWSNRTDSAHSGLLSLRIYRKVGDPATYQLVGSDGPRQMESNTLNTIFGLSIPVKLGDVLGLRNTDVHTACSFPAPGESYLVQTGNLAVGESGTFNPASNARLNVSAVLVPTNTFALGKLKRKRNGTAILTVNVPNPGTLSISGKGVKSAGAGQALVAKAVTAPGEVKLKIRAKGKKRTKLNATGKVRVNPRVTYAPTGGDASTQSTRVKLKKKL
jgi:hypothetical protein